jgi:transposase
VNVMEQGVQGLTTGTEGGRRPTGVPVEATTEVDPSSARRRLTIAYKIKVVETVQALRSEGSGSIGAYLRREGLYYSAVRKWTQQFERGELTACQNDSKAKTRQLQAENQRLRRKLEQTEKKLKKTEMIVEIQKKLSAILGLDQAPNNGNDAEP